MLCWEQHCGDAALGPRLMLHWWQCCRDDVAWTLTTRSRRRCGDAAAGSVGTVCHLACLWCQNGGAAAQKLAAAVAAAASAGVDPWLFHKQPHADALASRSAAVPQAETTPSPSEGGPQSPHQRPARMCLAESQPQPRRTPPSLEQGSIWVHTLGPLISQPVLH